jgi:ribosomal-protein-alanine acetyltransferase
MPDGSSRFSSRQACPEIREARSTDIEALVVLEAETFSTDKLSRRSFRSLIRSPSAAVVVARAAGRLLGYAVLLLRRGGRTARLYSIAVDKTAAGHGIGAALLAAVETAARKRSAGRLRLEVRADNAPAIRFYERHGYHRDGERPDYYQDGMTALLYSRVLYPTLPAASRRRLQRAA